jgi:hypothetical protein
MEKSFNLTRSGKAGRESGSTKEIRRKNFTKNNHPSTYDLKGKELSKILCKLLMGEDMTFTPSPDILCSKVKSEINVKLRTYKTSDASRSLPGTSISDYNVIADIMIRQKSKCYYCHKEFLMLYKNTRDPLQWSVDRIDNSKAHTENNIVISCLRCNLQRRTRDCEEFYISRNLHIMKEE